MEGSEHDWVVVSGHAARVLGRYRDQETCRLRDDITQEASLLVWQWSRGVDRVHDLRAATAVIVRRHRQRVVAAQARLSWLQFVEFGVDGVAEPVAPCCESTWLDIAGRQVSLTWATRRLPAAMAQLSALDRQLLLGLHEGFCCAELASRYGRSEDCVKTRIHRARGRLRREFENLVRRSGEEVIPEGDEL